MKTPWSARCLRRQWLKQGWSQRWPPFSILRLKETRIMAKATRYTEEMIKEYTEKGFWDDTRLCDLWEQRAQDCPDWIALADSALRLSYGEANRWIDRLALGFLEQGLQKDDLIFV